MRIEELVTVSDDHILDLLALMKELSPNTYVDADMLRRVSASPSSHMFAMFDGSHIIGTATLCVFDSPTGRKAHVEDVVVLSSYRGRRLGRTLVEHLIDYAHRELKTVTLYLTSSPFRVAANELYKSLGFRPKETNVYKMVIEDSIIKI